MKTTSLTISKISLIGAAVLLAACETRKPVNEQIYVQTYRPIQVQPGPAPAPSPTQAPEVEVEELPSAFPNSMTDTVTFEKGSAELSPQAQAVLDAQAAWLLDNDVSIKIEGHADEQGTRDYDIALSAKRAYAVRDYLSSKGVPRDRLKVTSFGKEQPLATCSDETCWSQNRRVVSVVIS